MSEKFVPGLVGEKATPPKALKMAWPDLSPAPSQAFYPGYRELESRVMKDLEEKVLHIEKEAYERGFEQGERDGRELGLRRLETVIHQLGKVLAEVERQKQEVFKSCEKELMRWMIEIGRRLFRRAVLLHESMILEVLKEAFQYVKDRSEILLYLNPIDYQYLSTHPEARPYLSDNGVGLRIVPDPDVTRGGCLLETDFGTIDATFETQFEELISSLLPPRESSSGENRP
ncbi:MAG: FliH/SctL family protein [Desulfobacterota bacterium]|nr:FliH/SctL family protein [Thermodesulfobacteriota bacterium]